MKRIVKVTVRKDGQGMTTVLVQSTGDGGLAQETACFPDDDKVAQTVFLKGAIERARTGVLILTGGVES